jgi:hypothetical protein
LEKINLEQDTQNPNASSLGISDLVLMLEVIQVVSRRGGFRADEMTRVGGLHDRLYEFLTKSGILKSDDEESTKEQVKEE